MEDKDTRENLKKVDIAYIYSVKTVEASREKEKQEKKEYVPMFAPGAEDRARIISNQQQQYLEDTREITENEEDLDR